MSTKMQSLAKDLVRAREMLQGLDNEYKAKKEPVEQAKLAIQEQLLKEMSKAEVLSTRYEDFTISRKKSKRAVVMDEAIAIAYLKFNNPQYVIPTISPEAYKEVEKGTLTVDGVTVETKEYISIRPAKE